jgi:hypothetical protein
LRSNRGPEGRKRIEKKSTNLTVVKFVDESDRGQIRRFLSWANQPGAVFLVQQGQQHDPNRVAS